MFLGASLLWLELDGKLGIIFNLELSGMTFQKSVLASPSNLQTVALRTPNTNQDTQLEFLRRIDE